MHKERKKIYNDVSLSTSRLGKQRHNTQLSIRDFLEKHLILVLPQPPHSPDLGGGAAPRPAGGWGRRG
jgi:hypothetical protein